MVNSKKKMNKENVADLAIVGAGIVGLAHAYHALKKGLKVVLFEREHFAVGASVRNFGMIWPIGQAPGDGLELALRSQAQWMDVANEAGFWINPSGSLHVVYHQDEWDVLNEFVSLYPTGYQTQLLSAAGVLKKSPAVNPNGLIGGLWSSTECVVNPREAVRRIPVWLQEKYGLEVRLGYQVNEISLPRIVTSGETWLTERVIVCNGTDFETLYPQIFKQNAITKCKLQMMKVVPAENFIMGPSLCAGLTLRHYQAFAACPSLKKVDERYDHELIDFKTHGVHVLVSQNNYGELIIGDSHHYGETHEPFDREDVNQIILKYLKSFVHLDNFQITERWHGIYPKLSGKLNLVVEPDRNVTVVNGLGSAGMTLSFGLAEQVIQNIYNR
jgi:FAD dependent oxidoreductase TIGR03364